MNIENKNHKDTVFRMLYRDKGRLLELYNAINKTHYTNPDDLTINTLEGMTFLNMKNDVSFVFNYEINLYEHNSTPCPNIPLRDLLYVAGLYRETTSLQETYKSKLIKVPMPRFYVFYNGTAPLPDQFEYKLSDMFIQETSSPSLELKVTVFNINKGKNKALLESCQTLKEYSIFVSKVRKYNYKARLEHTAEEYTKNRNEIIKNAVTQAIDECIAENILKSFFIEHRKEAINMSILECTAEEQLEAIAEGYYEEGFDAGIAKGINAMVKMLRSMNIDDNEIIQKIMEGFSLSEPEARKYL